VAARVSDISVNLDSQLKKKVKLFVIFLFALDENTDISDVAQQAIFIHGIYETLSVPEEFLGLVPVIDTITANDIFISLVGVLNRMGIHWSRAVGIATDSMPSMIAKKQVLRQKLNKKYRLYVEDVNFGHFAVFHTRKHCVANP